MRAVVQRVSNARVSVQGDTVGQIGTGVVALVGVAAGDQLPQALHLADRIANLRIFPTDGADMEISLLDVGGSALVVSQFTLYGDVRKGRRPSFIRAERGEAARALYQAVTDRLAGLGIEVATGRFGEMMELTLTNTGPCTILVDGDKAF
jgi:D-aminoacyl-tRNA deacylase